MQTANLPTRVPAGAAPEHAPDRTQSGPAALHVAPSPAPGSPTIKPGASRRKRLVPSEQAIQKALAYIGEDAGQLAAVTHRQGPLLILAGPGSGKTRAVTARIAYLVAERLARLQDILAVTFTARAAAEMQLRLTELLGVRDASCVTVCTLHSFCYWLLRAHADEFGRDADFDVADQIMVRQTARAILAEPRTVELREELERCQLHIDDDLLSQLLSQISTAKSRLWSIEEQIEHGPQTTGRLAAALWQELELQHEETNRFDFDDMLACCALLLRDPERREHLREMYGWMLIDEFQDINPAQMAIVNALMAPEGNLTVVGDDDQALYGWRSADPENIRNFTAHYPTATTVTLTSNYRSRKEIVEVASRLIAHNHNRAAKTISATRGAGAAHEVRFYPTNEQEAQDICARVQQELLDGRPPKEILIVCRNLRPLRLLQQHLQEHGVKVRLIGGQSLWERSESQDAIAYLTVLANPYDQDAFKRAINAPTDAKPFERGAVSAPKRAVTTAVVGEIVRFAASQRIEHIEACLRADEITSLPDSAVLALREFAAPLDRIRQSVWSSASCSIGSIVNQVLRTPGGLIDNYTQLRDHARNRAVREDANRVLQDLRSLARAATHYEEATPEAQPTLAGFLTSLATDEAHEIGFAEDDRVTLCTVHAAKGAEAQLVIAVAFEEGLLPDQRQASTPSGLEEERRLAYTAITRAADDLLITHVATRNGVQTGGPSRFLAEAGLL